MNKIVISHHYGRKTHLKQLGNIGEFWNLVDIYFGFSCFVTYLESQRRQFDLCEIDGQLYLRKKITIFHMVIRL